MKNVDGAGMEKVLLEFPAQCRRALEIASGQHIAGEFNRVLVCGMGGSGIGGDVLKAVPGSRVPVQVVKGYEIPASVDRGTLVMAVSYSGNTEETLSAIRQAGSRGARVVAITSGGELPAMADKIISVPGGFQPRNALGYLFFTLARFLCNSGLADIKDIDFDETVSLLGETGSFNKAGRELAEFMQGRTPVIYTSDSMSAAGYRLKCQINENAKHPAFHHTFPEMCHNELVAFAGMERDSFAVLMLRDEGDHERVRKRMDICKGIFEKSVDVREVWSRGTSFLARIFSLIYLGDWASYHLALLKVVDPTPVEPIERLKKLLL
jgi:glucose/mannose-6-phosphate isomerase